MPSVALHYGLLVLLSFIIIRDDVDDRRYVDYAREEAFQSFSHFRDGAGTLVHAEWVLTARHVARDLALGDPVYVGGDTLHVSDVRPYPRHNAGTPDLALVRLDRPVTAVVPAALFRSVPEPGTPIHLIGRGDTGTGLTGPTEWDKVVRGATNRIDEITAEHILFRFDAPGDPRATALEGISGPGDSGGPAYVWDEAGVRLVGVSSAQDQRGLGRPGVYGVVELYVNVPRYTDWIDGTLAGRTFVVAADGADEIAGWLDGEAVVSVERNGEPLPSAEHGRYRDLLRARRDADRLEESAVAPAERMPLFIEYVFALAHEAGRTEAVRPVNFSVDETALVVEGEPLEAAYLEKALARYRELFGRAFEGGFEMKVD